MDVKGRWTVTGACGPYNLGGSATTLLFIKKNKMMSLHQQPFAAAQAQVNSGRYCSWVVAPTVPYSHPNGPNLSSTSAFGSDFRVVYTSTSRLLVVHFAIVACTSTDAHYCFGRNRASLLLPTANQTVVVFWSGLTSSKAMFSFQKF